jgi:hypothetical protein
MRLRPLSNGQQRDTIRSNARFKQRCVGQADRAASPITLSALKLWRTGRDCSEHARGMFLVLADARIGPLRGPPKIACRQFCRTSVRSPLPDQQIKKGPTRRPFLIWRTERDSNPRTAFTVTHFPGVRLQPLGHLSAPGRGRYTAPRRPARVGFAPEKPADSGGLPTIPRSGSARDAAAAASARPEGPGR